MNNPLEIRILAAVRELGSDAYGWRIWRYLNEQTHAEAIRLDTLLNTLEDLQSRGIVRSWYVEPAERGGYRKRYWEII